MPNQHQITLYGFTKEEVETLRGILQKQFNQVIGEPEAMIERPGESIKGIHYHGYAQTIPLAAQIEKREEADEVASSIVQAFRNANFTIAHVNRHWNSKLLNSELVTDGTPPEHIQAQMDKDLAEHRANVREGLDVGIKAVELLRRRFDNN